MWPLVVIFAAPLLQNPGDGPTDCALSRLASLKFLAGTTVVL